MTRERDSAADAPPEYLDGLGNASPEVQQRIVEHARRKRLANFLRTPPMVVQPDEFVSLPEARSAIKWPDARQLVLPGYLWQAYRVTDGEFGFTRSSVERELQWRERASIAARVRRQARNLLGPLIGWWRYPDNL